MNQSSIENADAQSFAEAFEESLDFKTPEKGDVLKGTIVSISGDDAYIAYGGPTEALIDAHEVADKEVGDEVEATVVAVSPEIRVSTRLLARRASIEMVRQAMESGIPVEGKVAARNKGGFDVNISGVRAFCPLSQIDLGKITDPDSYIGKSFDFKILEMSEDGRKLVISRAALIKEKAADRAKEALNSLAVGARIKGRVKNLVPFGAFIDLGGVEGLLHVSEMSRRRVDHPKEIMKVGDEVEVKVLAIENGGERISLSRKDLEPDPWDNVEIRYQVGATFSGKVVRKADFGVFVELEPGLDGLVHRSQLPLGSGMNDQSLQPGTMITGWIREIEPARRRLSLAMRQVPSDDPWEFAVTKYPSGRVMERVVERTAEFGAFVEVEPGLTGLVPGSEMDLAPNERPETRFKAGDRITVKVLTVDVERRRMSLTTHTESMSGEIARPDETEAKGALALALEKALGKST